MDDNVIVVKNLVKYFDGRCVLDGISFSLPAGCIYGLLGRNGAGKTTIIRILLALVPLWAVCSFRTYRHDRRKRLIGQVSCLWS